MTSELQQRVHEIHPEVSFWMMNMGKALRNSKKSKAGERERLSLLKANGFPDISLKDLPYRKSDVATDDVVDACAAAWSGRRILEKKAISFPPTPDIDERGLMMRIET